MNRAQVGRGCKLDAGAEVAVEAMEDRTTPILGQAARHLALPTVTMEEGKPALGSWDFKRLEI